MWFLLILKIFILASANSFESDYFDDSTLFRISIQNRDVLDNRLGGKNTPESLIPIVSADDEKYFCIIPEIITKVEIKCCTSFIPNDLPVSEEGPYN